MWYVPLVPNSVTCSSVATDTMATDTIATDIATDARYYSNLNLDVKFRSAHSPTPPHSRTLPY